MRMDAQNRRMRTNETRMRHEEMHRQQQRYQQRRQQRRQEFERQQRHARPDAPRPAPPETNSACSSRATFSPPDNALTRSTPAGRPGLSTSCPR